ncbi:MAG: hypothetical protein ACRD1T_27225, partial [Acidimicrobiia bacterium]
LQSLLEAADPFFPWLPDMATTSKAIALKLDAVGVTSSVQGPGRVALVEDELGEDVLFHRHAVVEESGQPDLRASVRAFRAYIQSSLSVVEAFLNRHARVLRAHGRPEDAFRLEQISLDTRFEAWEELFARGKPIDRAGAEWSQFSEIRRERNRVVHALEPLVGYSLTDMSRLLNYVRRGVGGLLSTMRSAQRLPSLYIIDSLQSAPKIEMSP